MNAATLDHPESLELREIAPVRLPESRRAVEFDTETHGDSEPNGKSRMPVTPKKSKRPIIMALAALAVSAAVASYYVRFVAPYESTDDAFIDAHITTVAPQVAGRIARVLVNDNQAVQPGDVLAEIDPRDYQAKLDQAVADLAAARSRVEQNRAQLAVDEAKVGQEKASVVAADAEAKRAEADAKRYQAVGIMGVSESQLDLATTRARSSAAEVDVARNRELAAEAQAGLDHANIQTAEAEVQKDAAAVHQAELDLSYTRITAPEAGYVTHRTVEAGAYAQIGQALLAVMPREVWVTANFKETQLAFMRAGQPVEVRVDAYPGVKFHGRVDSIQAGAGARFSLLPPENASGNYVKVVQRVPVKIVLDKTSVDGRLLGAGMSVVPEVRVK